MESFSRTVRSYMPPIRLPVPMPGVTEPLPPLVSRPVSSGSFLGPGQEPPVGNADIAARSESEERQLHSITQPNEYNSGAERAKAHSTLQQGATHQHQQYHLQQTQRQRQYHHFGEIPPSPASQMRALPQQQQGVMPHMQPPNLIQIGAATPNTAPFSTATMQMDMAISSVDSSRATTAVAQVDKGPDPIVWSRWDALGSRYVSAHL